MGIKDIQSEVDAMDKALSSPEPGEEELRTDPPGTEGPGTEIQSTEPPKTEAAATEAPKTEAAATEAPKTSAPKTPAPEEDERDKTIRELREEIARRDKTPKTPAPKTAAPKTAPPPTHPPISEEDFLGDADLDELTRDPKAFNVLLNKIYKKAREDARGDIQESSASVVKGLPDIVKMNIAIHTALMKANETFYGENEDLKPYKDTVAKVFEELAAANPDKTYNDLIKGEGENDSLLSREVRKRLSLHKQTSKKKEDPPGLPRKKGGQRSTGKPELTAFEKELDAMDSALES